MWQVIDFNVIPLNDTKEHAPNNQCWCNPDYDDGVYIHHSMDNRELTEGLAKSWPHNKLKQMHRKEVRIIENTQDSILK